MSRDGLCRLTITLARTKLKRDAATPPVTQPQQPLRGTEEGWRTGQDENENWQLTVFTSSSRNNTDTAFRA
jgi:hypothetical protein